MDSLSFEEIVSSYNSVITKICYYFSESKEEFDDLRQETLINLWKGLDKFRSDSKISTWIYRVCFNSCISFTRKNRNKVNLISIDSIADIETPGGFSTAQYNELHRLIAQLTTENKAIILMWLDEKSYDEISEITGLNRNTVATRLARIKEQLVKMSNQ
ncbi:MAG: sigma-70 family RNA polymerase sigma factor [Muribaculaceae bacterium]|nr:sigma-70 family RNA polymerase sigma factor [Muribaculaceae bacterium]